MDLKSGHDLDGWWIDDGLTHECCFPLFYLLTYLYIGKFLEKFRKISRILFFRKSYNPSDCYFGHFQNTDWMTDRKVTEYFVHMMVMIIRHIRGRRGCDGAWSGQWCLHHTTAQRALEELCHGSPVSPPPTQSPSHARFQSAPQPPFFAAHTNTS